MPFSPHLIPGHPCVIIDRFVSDGVREDLGLEPVQYLGVIQRLDHSISQEGGSTSVALTHLRTHQEQAEFLGAGNVTVVKRSGSKRRTHRINVNAVVDAATGAIISTSAAATVAAASNTAAAALAPAAGLAAGTAATQATPDGAVQVEPKVGAKGPGGGTIVEVNPDIAKTATGAVAGGVAGAAAAAVGGGAAPAVATVAIGQATGAAVVAAAGTGTIEVVESIPVYKKHHVVMPLEEVVRPPWIASMYDNDNIGREYYMKMFGCLSLVDEMTVGHPEARPGGSVSDAGGGSRPKLNDPALGPLTENAVAALGGGLLTGAGQAALGAVSSASTSAVASLSGGAESPATVPGLGTASHPNTELDEAIARTERLVAQIKQGSWISAAIEQIVAAYRELKLGGYDVQDFIRQITWRPIATEVQILGSPDLVYDDETSKPASQDMVEGFHSRAYGPYPDLAFLDHKASTEADDVGTERTVDDKIDPRNERWSRVQTYAETLRRSRGLLG
jgi:hypothetical protein